MDLPGFPGYPVDDIPGILSSLLPSFPLCVRYHRRYRQVNAFFPRMRYSSNRDYLPFSSRFIDPAVYLKRDDKWDVLCHLNSDNIVCVVLSIETEYLNCQARRRDHVQAPGDLLDLGGTLRHSNNNQLYLAMACERIHRDIRVEIVGRLLELTPNDVPLVIRGNHPVIRVVREVDSKGLRLPRGQDRGERVAQDCRIYGFEVDHAEFAEMISQ